MDFKSLISKLDSMEAPPQTPAAPVLEKAVQLNEDAQLRVLSGRSTYVAEAKKKADDEKKNEKVKEEKADLGIALDGDADRLQLVDAHGRLFNGDELLYLIAKARKDAGESVKGVVGTLMTNMAVEKAIQAEGIQFERAKVGDRYVLENMLAKGHKLGGEQSGHIIMRDFANTGDGLLTALQLMSVMAKSKKSLADLAQVMKRFPQVLINVPNVAKDKLNGSKVISAAVAKAEATLADSGRVLLRASGTEPLIRVMVEASSDNLAQEIAASLAATVKAELEI